MAEFICMQSRPSGESQTYLLFRSNIIHPAPKHKPTFTKIYQCTINYSQNNAIALPVYKRQCHSPTSILSGSSSLGLRLLELLLLALQRRCWLGGEQDCMQSSSAPLDFALNFLPLEPAAFAAARLSKLCCLAPRLMLLDAEGCDCCCRSTSSGPPPYKL
jgi:hypothetical protein